MMEPISEIDVERSKSGSTTRTNRSFHHFRFIVLLCSGFATGLMMIMRLSITVALISMVNHTQLYIDEHQNATQEEDYNFRADYVESGEFDWNNEIQETLISCYMITYVLFPVITTRAIIKFGLNISIIILFSILALASFVTPTVAQWGWQWLVALRLVTGAASSGIIPGMVRLIELWTPAKEAANSIVIYQFTSNIVTILSPLLSGFLAQIDWRLVFYVPGCLTLIFCLIWFIFVSDSPETSRFLSQAEFDHITEICPDVPMNEKEPKRTIGGELRLSSLFKVKYFWFLAFGWSMYCITSGVFNYLLPTYLHGILGISVQEIGILTFTAQIGTLFSMLWPNPTVELFKNTFNCSLSTARKLVVTICVFIATWTILYLAAYHEHVVAMICIHRFFHMTHDTIFLSTVLSNFGHSGSSGLVYSILNSIGLTGSSIFCIIIGRYLDYTGDPARCWSWIFLVMATMNIVYLSVYCLLCHSKPVMIKSMNDCSEVEANAERACNHAS